MALNRLFKLFFVLLTFLRLKDSNLSPNNLTKVYFIFTKSCLVPSHCALCNCAIGLIRWFKMPF